MMNNYIVKNGKELKFGYTTGSCATAAAAAAAEMMFTRKPIDGVSITLPNGSEVYFLLEDTVLKNDAVYCSVIKNAGDDPDVTDGAKIGCKLMLTDSDIVVTGSRGVGIVTKKGLQCEVGEYAINPVPKKMIAKNVERVLKRNNYSGGVLIEISVENGEELAKKTYNPRLGIVGGISILGTTGIVEPMSEQALIDTIKILIDKSYAQNSERILISPGNYGEDYCKNILGLDINKAVKISNYIGEALDYIRYKGFKEILLVGHFGKLIKLAAGVMNTHSSYADCRMEIIAAHAAMFGLDKEKIVKIMNCITTDEALEILKREDIYDAVMKSILNKILKNAEFRLKGEVNFNIIMFNTAGTHVIKSTYADEAAEKFRGDI